MGIKKIVKSILNLVGKSNYGYKLIDLFIEETMNRTQRINHNGVELLFSTPNSLNQYRADTFSIKEPETLTWIDGFEQGRVVWDIGANVGIYSCYAAKHRNCKVYAFEPSVFNHELLSKNAFLMFQNFNLHESFGKYECISDAFYIYKYNFCIQKLLFVMETDGLSHCELLEQLCDTCGSPAPPGSALR